MTHEQLESMEEALSTATLDLIRADHEIAELKDRLVWWRVVCVIQGIGLIVLFLAL